MPLPHFLSGPDLSSWRFNTPKAWISTSYTSGPKEEIRIVEGDKTAIFCGA